jgi:hypothetical protein
MLGLLFVVRRAAHGDFVGLNIGQLFFCQGHHRFGLIRMFGDEVFLLRWIVRKVEQGGSLVRAFDLFDLIDVKLPFADADGLGNTTASSLASAVGESKLPSVGYFHHSTGRTSSREARLS